MNAERIDGKVLNRWREERKFSLRDVAEMLGVSSPSTINAWEAGQDIPGPAQLLLGMLIYGKQPFGAAEDTSEVEAKHFWQLKMTLADWHKLECLAGTAGYASVRDYLLSLIQEHLNGCADEAKPLFSGHHQEDFIKPEACAPISPNVSTAPSSATGPKTPSRRSSGATIVPLPTANWSESATEGPGEEAEESGAPPPVSEERTPVVYQKKG